MADRIQEIKSDISELQSLECQATRHKVKDLLSLEIRKLNAELGNLQQQQLQKPVISANKTEGNSPKRYQVKLKDYAWDQSSKYVKFYITLKNVHTIPSDNVMCTFTERSLEMNVRDLENRDYLLVINNLLYPIAPTQSNWKVKSDMVIINVAKVKEVDWTHVTSLEKKVTDAKNEKYKPEASGDPSDGIMSLMKKMYDDGDDEMKRTIAKAWTESQTKTNAV